MKNLLLISGIPDNMEYLLYSLIVILNGYLFAVLCCAKTPKYQKLSLIALISISFMIAGIRYKTKDSEFMTSLLIFLTFSFGNYIIYLWRAPKRKEFRDHQEFIKKNHLEK